MPFTLNPVFFPQIGTERVEALEPISLRVAIDVRQFIRLGQDPEKKVPRLIKRYPAAQAFPSLEIAHR